MTAALFYRVISKDSRKPDGVTYEGVKFGDPAAHYSCRTGRVWAVFAAWAMMKKLYPVRKRQQFDGKRRALYP